MKTKMNNNLTNIRNFFHLICYEQNATREEVHNFLQELLKYVFKKNNININDYTITLHCVKEEDKFEKTKKQESKLSQESRMFSHNTKALMMHDKIDPTLFDIYYPHEFISLKPTTDQQKKPKSKKKNETEEIDELYVKTRSRVKNLENFLEFIYNMFHEMAHMMQYIQEPEQMKMYDDEIEEMDRNRELIEICLTQNKEKRRLLKTIDKYVEAQGFIAPYETDANEKADEYFYSLLQTLIRHEQDEELLDFFCLTTKFLKDLSLANLEHEDVQAKFSEEAKEKLEELNLSEHLFLNASDYLYFTKND